jgi:hypothetical protein
MKVSMMSVFKLIWIAAEIFPDFPYFPVFAAQRHDGYTVSPRHQAPPFFKEVIRTSLQA